jgi:hypothetical protein
MSSNSNTPSINDDENQADNSKNNNVTIPEMQKSNEFVLKNRNIGPNSAYSVSQKIKVSLQVRFA